MICKYVYIYKDTKMTEEFFEIEDNDDVSTHEDDDSNFDIFSEPLTSQIWEKNENTYKVSYHFKNIRDVAPFLASWCFNRKLNEDHKNKIKNDLLLQKNPHLMSSIQVVRDDQKKCKIINGQHRIKAIEEILKSDVDMKFNMNIMFEVYDINIDDVDDIDNNTEIEALFTTANNSLNFKPEDDHEMFCKRIIIAMSNDPILSRGLVDKTTGRVNKPKIAVKELFEAFKENYSNNNLTIEEIIKKIKKINNSILMMDYMTLYGRKNPAENKLHQKNKAVAMGFHLNLNCKYPQDVWIKMIK